MVPVFLQVVIAENHVLGQLLRHYQRKELDPY